MKYKVMLADDEPIMRKALLTLIHWEQINCEIVGTAENGQEVLQYLSENSLDILITDIKMPGADGIEIAKYIWERKLATKVILLTAYADFSYAQSAVKYNVVEYVTKTGSFEQLMQAVERCKMIFSDNKQLLSEENEVRIENFFRGIYDGTIYYDIEDKYRKMGLKEENYAVILFKFLMDDITDRSKKIKVYDSLKNFFSLAFSESILQGMFYEKDIYGLLFKCSSWDNEKNIFVREICTKVMDMMDNFMELFVYIGISDVHETINELPEAYEEAKIALRYSSLETSEKLNFYQGKMKTEKIPVVSSDTKQKIVKQSMEYIEQHFGDAIIVADIAKEIGTSVSYLSRIFKEYTGETIIRTINQKKVVSAKKYLKETDMKIYEVADTLGFENVTYFSRFFKKHVGMSPKEYKEKMIKESGKYNEILYRY